MALVMNTVLSVEQRLSKAMADIMAVDPAIAPVLMIGKRVVCDKTQTACTNGMSLTGGHSSRVCVMWS